jgi:hypothetical protein
MAGFVNSALEHGTGAIARGFVELRIRFHQMIPPRPQWAATRGAFLFAFKRGLRISEMCPKEDKVPNIGAICSVIVGLSGYVPKSLMKCARSS